MISKFNISILVALFIVSSCSTDTKSVEVGAIPMGPNAEILALEKTITHFKTKGAFPFVVDTVLLNKLNPLYDPVSGFDSLGTGEIKTLAINWFTNGEAAGTNYDIKEFYKIDSIKASGTYAAWCEKLDIAQTKRSNAYAIQKMELDTNTLLLIWALTNSSYEACPYFSSQSIYFSIIYKGALSQTYYLGESSAYGDPPISTERIINGKLTADGVFELNSHQINDEDMDQPFIFVSDQYYKFAIKEGKIQLLKMDQKENGKTPRPKTVSPA